MKIGVGILTRPDDKPYAFATNYPVIDRGKWKVNAKADQVVFTHELKDKVYSYNYEKSVQLVKDKPELVLIHKIKNTEARQLKQVSMIIISL